MFKRAKNEKSLSADEEKGSVRRCVGQETSRSLHATLYMGNDRQ
jgi:hypothetical protein